VTGRRSSLITAAVLALIIVGAWGVREAYLSHMEAAPGFQWADPDSYTQQARTLVDQDGRWRWSWGAVHYEWNYRTWVLPPGYPVFLSWFARDRAAFPANAAHAHPVLGAALCALVFWLAARLHSSRAGLVAAAIAAAWLPSASGAYFFMQEQLYVPLLTLAFAVMVEAWVRESKGPLFAAAGVALGAASLTRAMPLYFAPVVVAVLVLGSSPRRLGWQRAGSLVAGVAALVLPYVVWLSVAHGQFILVDNHGPIEMERTVASRTVQTPGVADTVVLLAKQVAASPWGFAAEKMGILRGLFQVQGGRWLQYYGDSRDARSAAIWKWTAHAGIDLLFVSTALLAPLGLVLARRPRESILLASWLPVHLGLTMIVGYAGARYRAGIEPHLMVLASVVLAGAWRRPGRGWLALALCGCLGMAALVLPQVPRSLRSYAQYGIAPWDGAAPGATTVAAGPAGLNILPRSGRVTFSIALADGSGPAAVPAVVWLNRSKAANVIIGQEPRTLTLAATEFGYAYVEIEPLAVHGQPSPRYTISLPR
jgi:hypothetical protein